VSTDGAFRVHSSLFRHKSTNNYHSVKIAIKVYGQKVKILAKYSNNLSFFYIKMINLCCSYNFLCCKWFIFYYKIEKQNTQHDKANINSPRSVGFGAARWR
jgi:hypothetical protein